MEAPWGWIGSSPGLLSMDLRVRFPSTSMVQFDHTFALFPGTLLFCANIIGIFIKKRPLCCVEKTNISERFGANKPFRCSSSTKYHDFQR